MKMLLLGLAPLAFGIAALWLAILAIEATTIWSALLYGAGAILLSAACWWLRIRSLAVLGRRAAL
jgi:hypothetical protein